MTGIFHRFLASLRYALMIFLASSLLQPAFAEDPFKSLQSLGDDMGVGGAKHQC